MFESAAPKNMKIEQCGALITGGELYNPDAIAMLRSFATIVNVSDVDEAKDVIRQMSGLNGKPTISP